MATITIRGTTITASLELFVEECCACGTPFAFPIDLYKRLQAAGTSGTFYCPRGHTQHYVNKPLEAQLAEAKNDAAYYHNRLGEERKSHQHTTNRLNATRGVVTRIRKRVQAGICPCCNRKFAALERHMATKHPDYAASDPETPPRG